jgi:hypothetical protein
MVPHALPDQAGLSALARGLPLRLRALRDEPHLYLALLQVRAHARVQDWRACTCCSIDLSRSASMHVQHLLALQVRLLRSAVQI